jgi:glycerophosphoryl diester phosphodiesterase
MGPRAVTAARLASLAGRVPRHGADCLQVPTRSGGIPIVTAGFVRAAHRAGLHVHVWTINEPAEMRALLDLGVDGVMTDRPRLLAGVFAERGLPL